MGDTIADCMQYYFDQSDQLDMVVKLASREREDGLGMVVGAMLVQRLPDMGARPVRRIMTKKRLPKHGARLLPLLAA